MRKIGLAAFAAMLSGAPGAALAAQHVPEEVAVVTAGVTSLLHHLRTNDGVLEGIIRYDPRALERRVSDLPGYTAPVAHYALAPRENGVAAAARTVMGAEIGNLETARVCANDSLRSCSLNGAVAVFATSEPVVCGESAHVLVKALWMSNLAKQPVQEGIFRVTLMRGSDGWQVARTETLFIS
jgi:hypothetical protein